MKIKYFLHFFSFFLVSVFFLKPAFADTQSKIIFAKSSPNAGIYSINPDGTDLNLISSGNGNGPKVSPDGTKIVFYNIRFSVPGCGKEQDIYTMNIDGSDVQNLTDGTCDRAVSPTWSPDGTKIAYVNNKNSTLNVMNSDGSNNAAIAIDSSGGSEISWSPDGTKIAYVNNIQYTPNYGIYTISPSGGDSTFLFPIVSPQSLFGGVSWSPDGTKLAFTLWDGSSHSILTTINSDGSNENQLYTLSNSIGLIPDVPSWSPDSQQLAFPYFEFATDSINNHEFNGIGIYNFSQGDTGTINQIYADTNGQSTVNSLSWDTINSGPAAPAAAINAGGDTQGDFIADTEYNGGATFTTSASIDTSGVTNPAPTALYQSVRYGNFSYTIPNLTANGTYTLQLHFSEPYWGTSQAGGGGVGSRIFNVSVNGTQVLSDFDVYQAAGGANKAVMEQIPATADSNGDITIIFSNVVDNAMVSGIAVYNGTLPSPSPTPTPTPVSSLAISAGGAGSGSYISDTDYTGGTTYNTSATIDTSNVTNPAPQSVYQNVRYGNFSYTIPTNSPNTNYTVHLDFAEPYWNSAGQRLFNVTINGIQDLSNFDVYQQAGGENKAVSEQFTTTTDSNGLIHIQFNSVVNNAMVSGIQISQQ